MQTIRLSLPVLALCAGLVAQQQSAHQQWRQRSHAVQPPAQFGAGLAHDSTADVMLLFGGQAERTGGAPALSDDTWAYDGNAWARLSPATRPRARSLHGMTGDDHGNVYVFGGIHAQGRALDDLWRWNGTNWQQMQRGYVVPSRSEPAMASYGSGVFVFGGFDPRSTTTLGDTWIWSPGGDWSLQADGPSARRAARAVEMDRLRILVHGGADASRSAARSDTWIWQNGVWREVLNAGGPPRAGFTMVFDAESRQVFLHGGTDGTRFFDDLWRFDGARWWPMNPATRPSARVDAAAALDPSRHRIVVVGGESAEGVSDAQWEYSSTFPVQSFGAGCSTASTAPELRLGAPALGSPLSVQVYSPVRFHDLLLMTGFSNQSWSGMPLPQSLLGLGLACDLLVEPLAIQITSVPTGTSGLGAWLPIPADVSLSGLDLFLQGALLNSGQLIGVTQGVRADLY